MKKLSIPLCLIAAATLAACGTQQVHQKAYSEPVSFVAPANSGSLRTGPGKVTELLDPTGPVDSLTWQRMTLRMNDGSTQIVDRRGHQVAMGEGVVVK